MCASTKLNPAPSSGGSRKNIWGAWPLIIWEATTAKRNYYRTNYWCIAKKLDGYTLETWRRAASAERWKREDWGAERHGVLGGHPLPKNPTPLGASILALSALAARRLVSSVYPPKFFSNTPVIGSIVISLSRCCLPNDEGPGPQIFFPRTATAHQSINHLFESDRSP